MKIHKIHLQMPKLNIEPKFNSEVKTKVNHTGFKMNIQKQNPPKTVEKRSESPIKKEGNIYQILGIQNEDIKEVNQMVKTHSENKNNLFFSKNSSSDYLLSIIQNKIQKLRIQRNIKFANIIDVSFVKQFQKYNYQSKPKPDLSKILIRDKEGHQQVIHAVSSLQANNLQNVQIQLQAHRKHLMSLQNQYMEKKGFQVCYQIQDDNQRPYIYKVKQQNLIEGFVPKKKKMLKEQDYKQVLREYYEKYPDRAKYNNKFKEFLFQKQVKKKINKQCNKNLYKWDNFTNLQNAKKPKKQEIAGSSIPQQMLSQVPQPILGFQKNQIHILDYNSLLQQKPPQIKKTNATDKFIIRYMFRQIDVSKCGFISKSQVIDFFKKNKPICQVFNSNNKWFHLDLENHETKRKEMMDLVQFSDFLIKYTNNHPQIIKEYVAVQEQQKIQKILKIHLQKVQQQMKLKRSYSIISDEDMKILHDIFQKTDQFNDMVVKRVTFINNIKNDQKGKTLLNIPVVKITVLNRFIKLGQILDFILNQYKVLANEHEKKLKEFITWSQFQQYITNLNQIELYINRPKKTLETKQHQIFDIEAQHLQLLLDLFNQIPRYYQNYVKTSQFVQWVNQDPQFQSMKSEICRIQSVQTKLPIESIQMTVRRILKEGDDYHNWDQLKLFFSRRGRTLDWNQKQMILKRAIRQRQKNKTTKDHKRTVKIQEIKNGILERKLIMQQLQKKMNHNYTVPKSFNITDQNKKKVGIHQRKFNEYIQEKQKQLEEIVFKPLQVPQQIKQPLYQNFIQRQKQKSQKRKLKSKTLSQQKSQPFSFYNQQIAFQKKKKQDIQNAKKYEQNLIKNYRIIPKKVPETIIKISQNVFKNVVEKKKPTQFLPFNDRLVPQNPQKLNLMKKQAAQKKWQKIQEVTKKKQGQLKKEKERIKARQKNENQKREQHKKILKQQEQKQKEIIQKIEGCKFSPEKNTKNKIPEQIPKNWEQIVSKGKLISYEKTGKTQQNKNKRKNPQKKIEQRKKQQHNQNQQEKTKTRKYKKQDQIYQPVLDQEDFKQYQKMLKFQQIPHADNRTMKQIQKGLQQMQRIFMGQEQKRRRAYLKKKKQEEIKKQNQNFQNQRIKKHNEWENKKMGKTKVDDDYTYKHRSQQLHKYRKKIGQMVQRGQIKQIYANPVHIDRTGLNILIDYNVQDQYEGKIQDPFKQLNQKIKQQEIIKYQRKLKKQQYNYEQDQQYIKLQKQQNEQEEKNIQQQKNEKDQQSFYSRDQNLLKQKQQFFNVNQQEYKQQSKQMHQPKDLQKQSQQQNKYQINDKKESNIQQNTDNNTYKMIQQQQDNLKNNNQQLFQEQKQKQEQNLQHNIFKSNIQQIQNQKSNSLKNSFQNQSNQIKIQNKQQQKQTQQNMTIKNNNQQQNQYQDNFINLQIK